FNSHHGFSKIQCIEISGDLCNQFSFYQFLLLSIKRLNPIPVVLRFAFPFSRFHKATIYRCPPVSSTVLLQNQSYLYPVLSVIAQTPLNKPCDMQDKERVPICVV